MDEYKSLKRYAGRPGKRGMGILHEYECAIRPDLKGKAHGDAEGGISRRVAAITRRRVAEINNVHYSGENPLCICSPHPNFLSGVPGFQSGNELYEYGPRFRITRLLDFDFCLHGTLVSLEHRINERQRPTANPPTPNMPIPDSDASITCHITRPLFAFV